MHLQVYLICFVFVTIDFFSKNMAQCDNFYYSSCKLSMVENAQSFLCCLMLAYFVYSFYKLIKASENVRIVIKLKLFLTFKFYQQRCHKSVRPSIIVYALKTIIITIAIVGSLHAENLGAVAVSCLVALIVGYSFSIVLSSHELFKSEFQNELLSQQKQSFQQNEYFSVEILENNQRNPV